VVVVGCRLLVRCILLYQRKAFQFFTDTRSRSYHQTYHTIYGLVCARMRCVDVMRMRINSARGVVVGRLDEGVRCGGVAEVWNDNRNVVGLDYCLGVGLALDSCLSRHGICDCLCSGLVFV